MNKNNLIISAVLLAVVLVAGFFAYQYFTGAKIENNNPSDGQNQHSAEVTPGDNSIIENPVQIEADTGGGGLTICMDKCGDNVCQKSDPDCDTKKSMNCICPETPQDCPQDCKQ